MKNTFKLNQKYFGFELISEEMIEDIHSITRIFKHEKSGAELIYISNDDDNKSFCINFKTPPTSDNGIAHIMEHSVLCGSKNYQVKDPFMSLVNSSLNTFLNAMTFSDKTMYPFASQNSKDFKNLLGIYLDAVFYPNLLTDPTVLHQEGWHYHLEKETDELEYRGVVYGEMQGAFSSPESVLSSKTQSSLYPDTCYKNESGGIPAAIPSLTQKEFETFHQTYYHPSNAKLFIYGNGDIEAHLKFIDENYLNDFEKIEINPEIKIQATFSSISENEYNYPVPENLEIEDQYFISYNFATSGAQNSRDILALNILKSVLFDSPASPLKKAILKENLAMDFGSTFDDNILQPYFSLYLKKCKLEAKEKFTKIIEAELKKIVENGIDKELLKSTISKKEFQLREADYQSFPKGLFYAISVMTSWNYDQDPTVFLKFEEDLKFIWDNLETGYFEAFITKHFLENSHKSIVILKPEKNLVEKKSKDLKDDLAKFKANCSKEELDKIITETKTLLKKQNTPDSPEQIASMPTLELSDLNKKTEKLPLIESNIDDTKLLLHEVNANGIGYLDMYFDLKGLDEEELHYLSFLTALLGKLDTENYNYSDLSNKINIETGGISFNEVVLSKNNSDDYAIKHTIQSKVLMNKFDNLLELISEIIFTTKFDNKEKIHELLKKQKSTFDYYFLAAGHSIAITRLSSYYSKTGKLADIMKNVEQFKFIRNLLQDFEANFENIQKNLEAVIKKIYNKNGLIISFSAEKDDLKFSDKIANFTKKLPHIEYKNAEIDFDFSVKNEAIPTPGNILFVAQGYNFSKLDYNYSGGLKVIQTAMGVDYLTQQIRVIGGAYGAFSNFSRSGDSYFCSYRDPNLVQTLETYKGISNYLHSTDLDDRSLLNFIIATIGKMDKPLTPSMKGHRAAIHYLIDYTFEDAQKERDEIINFKKDEIPHFADLIKKVIDQNYYCVVGNSAKISEHEDLFESKIEI